MSSKVRIELNREGVAALLKQEAEPVVADIARKIANTAASSGGEYGVDVGVGRTRARATVWTDDVEAMRQEASHRTLTRSIDAGRVT